MFFGQRKCPIDGILLTPFFSGLKWVNKRAGIKGYTENPRIDCGDIAQKIKCFIENEGGEISSCITWPI